LHNTDIRSDLYSLGCTFYFLLTGQVPFPGGSMMDKMIRHGTEAPQPIQQLRPDCPPVIAAIVEQLMAKRPEDRFQTPAELAAALEPFAVSGPTPWAPPRPASTPMVESSASMTDGLAIDSVPEVDGGPSGDLSALVNTVARDQSPTPMSSSAFSRILGIETRPEPLQRHWLFRMPLLTLFAVLGGFLAGFVVMQMMFGHK
jgi:serine/threonine protein kinase